MQDDLFAGTEHSKTATWSEQIDLVDGDVSLFHHWLSPAEAEQLMVSLTSELRWEQSTISMYGQAVKIPRLNAWYGDPNARYQYSGALFDPLPWTDSLKELKRRVEIELGEQFNSVLANLYRNGSDSVSWHSDNEPELGRNPVIASLSLGQSRHFLLKHRKDRDLGTIKLMLSAGDLLLMKGATQHHWLHSVPKVSKTIGPRINLTFRRVTDL
ncbi:alpha-ketoglutarate-dependent dioxygenase AlkB [Maricurvus nonylphenolicus]|uniref:alpha-ketoglutarate-dependent dioxygenase AlkB family protein n=1 Tax=Maricurvus nonylphenolicus TaxID=1008307 RepID=UPI0036F3C4D2